MTATRTLDAGEVYEKSDGALTTTFYAELQRRGPIGVVAVNLFRAQKCSSRAKCYGRARPSAGKPRYSDMAYERKQWSMNNLCAALLEHGDALGIQFGWKIDPAQSYHRWVLYVDLPQGQVSFHTDRRGEGPDYPGDWDRERRSAERIIRFCNAVYRQEVASSAL